MYVKVYDNVHLVVLRWVKLTGERHSQYAKLNLVMTSSYVTYFKELNSPFSIQINKKTSIFHHSYSF